MVYSASTNYTSTQDYHVPVMLMEVLNGLDECFRGKSENNKMVVDCTAGGMGHSSQIAQKLCQGDKLICIDKDIDAINLNRHKVQGCEARFVNDGFENITKILNGDKADFILADLGVSSFQIDNASRGFSYMREGRLDMRMQQDATRDAWHVVNHYTQSRLEEIIREYGEEKHAKLIASGIVKARPIDTTTQLSKVITDAVPGGYYKTGGHPAKRTFQAIRIEVNRELDILEQFVRDAVDCLKPDGRLAVITFHSLEDRIVKQTLKELNTDCLCPPKTPRCICGHTATVDIITRKPILPTEHEMKINPRSISAKLRIAQKKKGVA